MLRDDRRAFAQLVVGPPGSGKTTYCLAAKRALAKRGRKAFCVNLDPGNESAEGFDVDVRELGTVEETMERERLGPNGALVACVERLEREFEWLRARVDALGRDAYVLFDAPGQIELYCYRGALANIFERLVGEAGLRVAAVHLVDSHHCSEPHKFVAALIVSLSAMLRVALPHVNALSKADLLRARADRVRFGVDFYEDVLDLRYLLDDDDEGGRFGELNAALASLVEDYGLVSFATLDSHDEASVLALVALADRANGYGFSADGVRSIDSMLSCALGS